MTTKRTIEDNLLQEEFDKLDKDKTGKISAVDFRQFIVHGAHLKFFHPSTIDIYIAELSHETGWINFERFKEFVTLDTSKFKNSLITIELKQAFNEVDTNKDGFISPQEARLGITLAGQRISGSHFSRIAHMFDDNGDGKMSFEEFSTNIMRLFNE
ncbi:unnamed protein product [Rotaria magnacalcarata]|uniref:EF-hand domain-containing protein n=1 Tax=Rotaria magnacalcarata TaxID=392030 RepID=A0A816ZPU2_9BILA|nr:unnamed protein product [Rotaria magnacalcarata]CAF2225446.1 unnamed protein product [Rotaria magnacalcarata]CAF4133139.1 unnamed protein product [Rotaria magnacalcarata]CAF4166489.1 unnamed protein product [Rotaria magnacalcarata]